MAADAGGGGGGAGASYAARPDSLLSLRACTACRLVKTLNQFQDAFCDNCWADWADGATPGALKKTRCMDLAMENTTADYEGLTSMMRPFDSWVGKWLKINRIGEDGVKTMLKPGVYAISLPGFQRARAQEEEYEEDEAEEAAEEEGEARQAGKGRPKAKRGGMADDEEEEEEEEEEGEGEDD